MENLKANWFTEGLLDFEYKKYILLAWLQHVQKEFSAVKLYPSLSELVFHYNNLYAFKTEQEALRSQFPRNIDKDALRKYKLHWQSPVDDRDELKEISSIVEFSLPALQNHIEDGRSLFEHIDSSILIEPVGISPLYKREGYLLVYTSPEKKVDAYDYSISFFENVGENYYGIRMDYVHSFEKNMVNTFESMKIDLHRNHRKYDNPATYLVSSSFSFPEKASLIPVAKRKFLAYMRSANLE
jgi:hypothetical protein